MTRPSGALVLDGNAIKVRLQAERLHSRTPVHVDWLRFTTRLRFNPAPSIDLLFPLPVKETCEPTLADFMRRTQTTSVWDEHGRAMYLHRLITTTENCDAAPAMQARELADKCADILGPDFSVADSIQKGHDFYRFRWSITREGVEVGWVGFQASGSKKQQQAQANTLHVNLFGTACTFARLGWCDQMAQLIDELHGDITRADLALDFFDGYEGGLEQVVTDYRAGLCDVGGRRLKCATVGDWIHGRERSFYLGSKKAGKQTNVYEKGDQLYGPEAGSKWLRFELRYGNKLRELPSDILRRPADFFAGASEWHARVLSQADTIPQPQPITCTPRLPAETVEAEVTRNLRWAYNVAAPTIAAAWDHLGEDFLNLVTSQKLPVRLSKFKPSELAAAFQRAKRRFTEAGEVAPLPEPAF